METVSYEKGEWYSVSYREAGDKNNTVRLDDRGIANSQTFSDGPFSGVVAGPFYRTLDEAETRARQLIAAGATIASVTKVVTQFRVAEHPMTVRRW